MSDKIVKREIDGFDVRTVKMKPRKALKLLAKLIRVLGPGIIPIAMGGGMSADDSTLKGLMSLKEDDLDDVVCSVLSDTQVVSKGQIYDLADSRLIDEVFDDNFFAMIKTTVFVVEANFGNFTEGDSAGAELAELVRARKSTSLKT